MFSTFNAIALALARVSTFFVLDVISKGPKDELACVSLGKSLKFNVDELGPHVLWLKIARTKTLLKLCNYTIAIIIQIIRERQLIQTVNGVIRRNC